jgi:dTDP-D-glucose 4,6-dehydratase
MGPVASSNGAPNRPEEKSILVTGEAGFIGANFVLAWLAHDLSAVVSLDKLTYAGNLENLASVANDPRHAFVHGDIGDAELVAGLLKRYRPMAVVNFAAESHVDRSIHGPADFIALLDRLRLRWRQADALQRRRRAASHQCLWAQQIGRR